MGCSISCQLVPGGVLMSATGERWDIQPTDMAEARAEDRLPRRNLIRDSSEPVELRDGLDLPVISDYGARPRLAARIRSFIAWLEEETR
jgi:hypothetical protein